MTGTTTGPREPLSFLMSCPETESKINGETPRIEDEVENCPAWAIVRGSIRLAHANWPPAEMPSRMARASEYCELMADTVSDIVVLTPVPLLLCLRVYFFSMSTVPQHNPLTAMLQRC